MIELDSINAVLANIPDDCRPTRIGPNGDIRVRISHQSSRDGWNTKSVVEVDILMQRVQRLGAAAAVREKIPPYYKSMMSRGYMLGLSRCQEHDTADTEQPTETNENGWHEFKDSIPPNGAWIYAAGFDDFLFVSKFEDGMVYYGDYLTFRQPPSWFKQWRLMTDMELDALADDEELQTLTDDDEQNTNVP